MAPGERGRGGRDQQDRKDHSPRHLLHLLIRIWRRVGGWMLSSDCMGAGESPKEAFGLFALQHRGQESAGMAVSDGGNILVFKDLGLVSQVFNEGTLATLQGDLGIGHTRYSTTGSTTWENAQPAFKTDGDSSIALGHNGNLVNTAELAERAGWRSRATTDSDLVATMLA